MTEEEQEKKEEREEKIEPTGSSSPKPKDETTFIEDAREISKITTSYFITQNSNLAFLNFRIHSIKRNIKPDFWVVVCSFNEKFGYEKRVRYELHINKKGIVAEIKELT